jgi:hypothetical protein
MGRWNYPLQSTPLPVIYFDNTTCISHLNGIIGITAYGYWRCTGRGLINSIVRNSAVDPD